MPRLSNNPFEDDAEVPPPFDNPANYVDNDSSNNNNFNTTTAAEASWQYLGDLPYRKIPLYSHVRWDRERDLLSDEQLMGGNNRNSNDSAAPLYVGLAKYPATTTTSTTTTTTDSNNNNTTNNTTTTTTTTTTKPQSLVDRRELFERTTYTKVVACPYGGPIAAVTLPIVDNATSGLTKTEIRCMTNAGEPIWNIPLPLPTLDPVKYAPSRVLTIGFTHRATLVVVYKDSLCLTFDLQGELLLKPFYILPSSNNSNNTGGTELSQASVYEGGVAVLATNQTSALVELLDEHDDADYVQSAHVSARQESASTASATKNSNSSDLTDYLLHGPYRVPSHYALVTTFQSTADYAKEHSCQYLCIQVLPRTRTAFKHPEVFLSTNSATVIVVNAATTALVDLKPQLAAPLVDMVFAPNGRFLACFTTSSVLTVVSTTFETKVLDFDTSEGSMSPPLAMEWCGEDSVVLHWKGLGVLMVGPYGDWLRFPYEDTRHLYLLPEIDCCRVLTDNTVHLLQRVPPTTAALLRIGSIEPAAMLLDAADSFEAGLPASDDAARAIQDQLDEAVQACTEAATREFDITLQKRLMKAASFGMHFSFKTFENENQPVMGGSLRADNRASSNIHPAPTTIQFVESARKLRVINALRNPKIGFVITSAQYDAVGANGLVARLIAVQKPTMAASIAKHLSLPKYVQLYARAAKAAALVSHDDKEHSDSELAEAAIRIINDNNDDKSSLNNAMNRGGYATVAYAAIKASRPGVANLLLLLESSVVDKVPAFISSGSFADAVAVATMARDADYIFATLMEYERVCMLSAAVPDIPKIQANFYGAVISKFSTESFQLLAQYLQALPDTKQATSLYLRSQNFASAAIVIATRAMKEQDTREKQGILGEASRVFGMGKDTAFHKSCTDDYLDLLKDQEVLRTKYGSYDVVPETSSVTATIASVIKFAASNTREQHRLLADADKLGKKFRVPEKRLWHIKVKAFSDSEQWSNLRLLAESRAKPPIGFKPFARAAIKGKQSTSEVVRYIDRITVPEEKYDLLCEAKQWKQALDEAFKLRDTRRILNVKTQCNNPDLQLLADQLMGRLA